VLPLAATRELELRRVNKAPFVVTCASTPSGTSTMMLDAPAFTSIVTADVGFGRVSVSCAALMTTEPALPLALHNS